MTPADRLNLAAARAALHASSLTDADRAVYMVTAHVLAEAGRVAAGFDGHAIEAVFADELKVADAINAGVLA